MITLLMKRSIENPAVPISQDEAVAMFEGSAESAAGQVVNHNTALRVPAVWRAVELISGYVGKIPCHVYERDGAGKVRATEHPAYYPIRRKPNARQTAMEFRELMQVWVLLEGNAYAYKVMDGRRPLELIPLDPWNTTVRRVETGEIVYTSWVPKLKQLFLFEEQEIVHIKGPSKEELKGMSRLRYARESFGISLASQKHAGSYWKNSGHPSVAIHVPIKLKRDAKRKLRRDTVKMLEGPDNTGKILILDQSMKAETFAVSNADAQFLQSREFEVRQVANWFGIPPHLLGDSSKSSYKSLEQENQALLNNGIDPWLCRWEEELWDKLLSEEEKRQDTHIIEFLREAVIKIDFKAKMEGLTAATGRPLLTVDEARSKLNMNPLPDGQGEKLAMPLNMGFTNDDGTVVEGPKKSRAGLEGGSEGGSEPEDFPGEDLGAIAGAVRELLEQVYYRFSKRVAAKAQKAAAKDPIGFPDWLERELEDGQRTELLAAASTLASVIDPGRPLERNEAFADVFFHRWAEALGKSLDATPAELPGAVQRAAEEAIVSLPGRVSREAIL